MPTIKPGDRSRHGNGCRFTYRPYSPDDIALVDRRPFCCQILLNDCRQLPRCCEQDWHPFSGGNRSDRESIGLTEACGKGDLVHRRSLVLQFLGYIDSRRIKSDCLSHIKKSVPAGTLKTKSFPFLTSSAFCFDKLGS